MIFNIDAQVILGESIDLSPFVISYSRNHSMCNVAHIGEIKLSPNVLDFFELNEIDAEVYDSIRIVEYGVTVMTGYVARIVKRRTPTLTVSLFFSDTYKRAKDYFLDDPNFETTGETLGELVGTLCDLCGLSYSLDSAVATATVLPPGQPIGLTTVDGAIQQVIAYASAIVYIDGNGVLHLRRKPMDSDLQFSSGETLPKVNYGGSGWAHATEPTDITQGNVFSGTVVDSDENARDVVSVWGYYYNSDFPNLDAKIVSTQTVDLGLPVRKTAVYSSSLIQTQSEADRLSTVMIQSLGKLDEIVTVECQGDPRITILKNATVNIDLETSVFNKTKAITSVVTSVSENGYVMTVTFDEFCPKFAGWDLAESPTVLYAGTLKNGVYKSLDGGLTWADYNTGLTTGNKYVRSLAATQDDEVMAIINGQLWYTTTSGLTIANPAWERRYLSAPVNTAMDNPAPSGYGTMLYVTSPGTSGQFDVLTSYNLRASNPITTSGLLYFPTVGRSWVYNTTTAGGGSPAWDCTELSYITPSGGLSYNMSGQYMSNRYGTPLVTAGTFIFESGMWIYQFPMQNTCYYCDGYADPNTFTHVNLPHMGIYFGAHYWDVGRKLDGTPDYDLGGQPGYRSLAFRIVFYSLSGFNYIAGDYSAGGHTYSYATDEKLYIKPGSGSVIIDDRDTHQAWEVEEWAWPGIHIGPGNRTPWSIEFRVTVEEAVWGSGFWMFFALRTDYSIAEGYYRLATWRVYTGEPKQFDEDHYPWTYWPTYSRYQDLYPLYCGAGLVKFNLEEIAEALGQ